MSYLKLFQLFYPKLAKDMKNCSHHYSETELNPFHLENDIFTHTVLVLKELQGTDLEIPALLHDIGKLEVRYENHEKKRVRFSGHENMSAFMSLSIFKDLKLSQEVKERYFKLIAMHGEPYRLELDEIAKRCTNNPVLAHDLFQFGRADHSGRFYEGVDNHKTQMIPLLQKEESKFEKEVVFMIGLPGSGKSTYIKNNLNDHLRVSRDDLIMGLAKGYLTYDEAWKSANQEEIDRVLQTAINQAAKSKDNVVIDMTNLSRKQRTAKLRLFKDFKKKAVVLLPDLLTTFQRLSGRPDKTIPDEVIKNMVMGFSLPDLHEFDEIVWRFE